MPSAKQDMAEVLKLLRKRGQNQPRLNYFTELCKAYMVAVDGGFITFTRAMRLLEYLQAHQEIAKLYPNATLQVLLETIKTTGELSQDHEKMLLDFLYSLYVGYTQETHENPRISIELVVSIDGRSNANRTTTVADALSPPWDASFYLEKSMRNTSNQSLSALCKYFDPLPQSLDLKDKFVDFTGTFKFGSRRLCHEQVRILGGVPCEMMIHLDYLFVGGNLISLRSLSSTTAAAIHYRRIHGHPLLFRDVDWDALVRNSL